jgi:hypothetical protein
MLKKRLLYLPSLLLAAACVQQAPPAQPILKPGRYVGMDYMGKNDVTPDDSTDRWYHENTLVVKADSLFLESVPVVFYKNQPKAYSSSDGGFYSYKGEVYRRGNQLVAKLLLTNHDYILTPLAIPDSMKSQAALKISFEEKVKRGIYVVDSSFFRKQWAVDESSKGFTLDSVAYTRVGNR